MDKPKEFSLLVSTSQKYERVLRFSKLFNLAIRYQRVKTESIRKLSNFNSQWTKSLYQNILSHTSFFFYTFHAGAIDVISYL